MVKYCGKHKGKYSLSEKLESNNALYKRLSKPGRYELDINAYRKKGYVAKIHSKTGNTRFFRIKPRGKK